MMKDILRNLIISMLVLANQLGADEGIHFHSDDSRATLVELFTSQGCSSCPPADQWLSDLVQDPRLWKGIVPVAFHVDYWDYIGWQDSLASAEYTQRQRRYKEMNSINAIYTPGFVVNGKEWRGWFSGRELPPGQQPAGRLAAHLNSQQLAVSYSVAEDNLLLHVVLLGFGIKTQVSRGENRGKMLINDFVALSYQAQLSSDGTWQIIMPRHAIPGAERYAVALWVTRQNDLTPLQASGTWLPDNTGPP